MEHGRSVFYSLFRANGSGVDAVRLFVGPVLSGHFLHAKLDEPQCTMGSAQHLEVSRHRIAGHPNVR